MKKIFSFIPSLLLVVAVLVSASCSKDEPTPADESILHGTMVFDGKEAPVVFGYYMQKESGNTFSLYAEKDATPETAFMRFIISPKYCSGELHDISQIMVLNYYLEYQDALHYYVNELVSGTFQIQQLSGNGMFDIQMDIVFPDGKELKVRAKGALEKGVTK